jgi:hypothetical protein
MEWSWKTHRAARAGGLASGCEGVAGDLQAAAPHAVDLAKSGSYHASLRKTGFALT